MTELEEELIRLNKSLEVHKKSFDEFYNEYVLFFETIIKVPNIQKYLEIYKDRFRIINDMYNFTKFMFSELKHGILYRYNPKIYEKNFKLSNQ